MRLRGGHSLLLAGATPLILACSGDANAPAPVRCVPPDIVMSRVDANANNVLSAVTVARVRFADSVLVRFSGTDTSQVSATPAVASDAGDSVVVPILGLLPRASYNLELHAYNACATMTGTAMSFTTGALPSDLPRYTASGIAPTAGYIAFSAAPYGIVIDNTGRVVWYRRFASPAGPGLNFQPQPTGHYVARPPTPPGDTSSSFLELDALGDIVRVFGCARGLASRFHDLIALPDTSYWMMCDETRTMDLRSYGGLANAQVTGTVIQHVRASGSALFEWSAFDHFAITDLDSLERLGAVVNWTHGNAIDFDRDSNLIVSFRSLSEITKIDRRSGAVLWRMGGRASQFAPGSSGTPLFARQHGVRMSASGALQLLDNLGEPGASRVRHIVFGVDGTPRVAARSESWGSEPPVIALLGGSTQELPNGHVLAAYGNGNRVEEYDASGNVVWRIEGNPGYVFRAYRFPSLYKPGVGFHR
ncbi:MAG TPA: arylsulfotransferase family protein [Gemmatimonadaceae bacterium]|nr:arylsulfotransferase family protein [Gemmatimonadaceae bacterium]